MEPEQSRASRYVNRAKRQPPYAVVEGFSQKPNYRPTSQWMPAVPSCVQCRIGYSPVNSVFSIQFLQTVRQVVILRGGIFVFQWIWRILLL
ncbi:unnamed protein product [Ranitomeya imitator]|uniref:Uncharacterized protein n=1 Tax=Ranitomeya imitator TaxID=111125 RepID=A0ABN9LPF1_9NEOB|nr:unnamed protein product [Ranitomeya imitator]